MRAQLLLVGALLVTLLAVTHGVLGVALGLAIADARASRRELAAIRVQVRFVASQMEELGARAELVRLRHEQVVAECAARRPPAPYCEAPAKALRRGMGGR